MIVGICEHCGAFVLDTQPRVSAHGAIRRGDLDALVKQSGYTPNVEYGTGGVWAAPRLLHIDCKETNHSWANCS